MWWAGAKVLFGGKPLEGHQIPECYGAMQPTAVFVPLKEIMRSQETFDLVTTEVFGPLQACPVRLEMVSVSLLMPCNSCKITLITRGYFLGL